MVAARSPRMLVGWRYDHVIRSIDWNRVLIEARGEHLRHQNGAADVCGECIKTVLLRSDW
jgi:hypothetical protein